MTRDFCIFLLLLLAGCSQESTGPHETLVDIKGRWIGTTDSLKLDFIIFTERVGGGNITGVCYLNDTVYIGEVYGSYTSPNVCLILLDPTGGCNFSGKVGNSVIDGTFTYDKYVNKAITLKYVSTLGKASGSTAQVRLLPNRSLKLTPNCAAFFVERNVRNEQC